MELGNTAHHIPAPANTHLDTIQPPPQGLSTSCHTHSSLARVPSANGSINPRDISPPTLDHTYVASPAPSTPQRGTAVQEQNQLENQEEENKTLKNQIDYTPATTFPKSQGQMRKHERPRNLPLRHPRLQERWVYRGKGGMASEEKTTKNLPSQTQIQNSFVERLRDSESPMSTKELFSTKALATPLTVEKDLVRYVQ